MDLLSMLKMANIFSPQGPNQQQFPVGSVGGPNPMGINQGDQHIQDSMMNQQPQGMDLQSAIQGMLNPRDEQFQNYANMIQSMPKPQQYEPSKFRKVMAGIAGLGTSTPATYDHGAALGFQGNIPEGLKVQAAIKDEPYNKALQTWANQADPQGKLAQMEQNRNAGNRQLALGMTERQIQQQNADTREKAQQATAKNYETRAAISQQRADIARYKVEHPNHIIKEDSDGNLIGIDPSTNQATMIQDPDGNAIKSSVMTDADKFNLQQENKLKQISATGEQTRQTNTLKSSQNLANAKELENTRQLDRLGLAETNIAGRQQLQSTKPAATGTAAKPMLPTQQKQDTINRALKLVSEQPNLKPYIKFEKNNAGNVTGVTIPPTSDKYFAGLRGYNEADRMKAYNALFGQAPVPGVTQTGVDRNKAIDALRAAKIPITEDNIKKAMDPANWK